MGDKIDMAPPSGIEVWKPIPGYEGLYDASSLGRVLSRYRNGKIKSPTTDSDGYLYVFLYRDGKRHGHGIHRLVCLAFHGEPAEGMEAAHKDGNRTNNVPHNLAWATRCENIAHKHKHGTILRGERHPLAKLTNADIISIRSSSDTARQIAEKFGISRYTVADIRQGKRWA